MLTFNDSRQGTARSAMRMQLFSELTRIRGLLYHIALRDCQGGNDEKRTALEQEIATLETLPESARLTIQSLLDNKKKELAALKDEVPVSFTDMARQLENERSTFDALFRLYREKAPLLFSANSTTNFANMLIFREFGRRTAKAVNLETLGLMAVCYPALERVTDVPRELKSDNLTLQDWKDFLKICLDFVFRGNGATDFSKDWRKWLGMTYNQNFMLAPDEKESKKIQLIWPQCRRNRQHRLVRLLERALTQATGNMPTSSTVYSGRRGTSS